jgi:GNAT superfamily N-acetyltransferase
VNRHLVQLNVATLRHPIDDPRTADFFDALPTVNGAGEGSPGYVWRLQSDSGDATDIRVFDDPMVIVNLTVWKSLEDLKAFAYRGIHRDFFRRRAEWFVDGASRTALWWMRAGVLPTTDDAKRRLDFIDVFGPSLYAFSSPQRHPALVIEHVAHDDPRSLDLAGRLGVTIQTDGEEHAVLGEIDDVPLACGAYRRLDDTTVEIRRLHVAQSAHGLKVGAAIISELEAEAKHQGAQRMFLETWPRQLPWLQKFGFSTRSPWAESKPSADSIYVEKTLTA